MVRLKSNNLNLVDKEITKKFGSDAKPFKYKWAASIVFLRVLVKNSFHLSCETVIFRTRKFLKHLFSVASDSF